MSNTNHIEASAMTRHVIQSEIFMLLRDPKVQNFIITAMLNDFAMAIEDDGSGSKNVIFVRWKNEGLLEFHVSPKRSQHPANGKLMFFAQVWRQGEKSERIPVNPESLIVALKKRG